MIHNFNDDGFDSLAPKYAGGRPPTFTLPQRREIKKIALARPTDHDLPFSTWSLSKLAEFLVAEGVVDDISHEGLRALLREEGVSFQVIKTFKVSNDPDFEAKKNRILELYEIADGKALPGPGDPAVVICMDEFGPLNLQPHPGKQWAPVASGNGDSESPRRRRMRATYTRPNGVRHLMAGYDLSTDRLYGHVVKRKGRTAFLAFCRYLRSLHPPEVRIAIVLDNFSPHLSTKKDGRVGEWAEANNVEFAYTPFYGSWFNRIEAQFTALRYFALDSTDHPTHAEQARMIRRYIAWRNRNAQDKALRELVNRANVARHALGASKRRRLEGIRPSRRLKAQPRVPAPGECAFPSAARREGGLPLPRICSLCDGTDPRPPHGGLLTQRNNRHLRQKMAPEANFPSELAPVRVSAGHPVGGGASTQGKRRTRPCRCSLQACLRR